MHVDPATKKIVPNRHAPFLYRSREGTVGIFYVGVAIKEAKADYRSPNLPEEEYELDPNNSFVGRRFGYEDLDINP